MLSPRLLRWATIQSEAARWWRASRFAEELSPPASRIALSRARLLLQRYFINALLIYPEFPDTYWSFKHALRFLGKRAAQPPLGLMTVAALLPSAWKKRLIDTNVERLLDRDIAWADVALISGMHIQRSSLAAIVERCRARGLRTVIGGPLPAASRWKNSRQTTW